MSNPYYTPTGNPSALARGISAQMRNEFALIGAAFDAITISALTAPRVPRTSNTIIAASNRANLVDVTSGTFNQTVSASTVLTNGWYCYFKNSSDSDVVTVIPDGVETIDGLTSIKVYPGEVFMILSDGSNLFTVGRQRVVFVKQVAFTGVASVTITGPFSDAEITDMDVNFTMEKASGASIAEDVTVGGWGSPNVAYTHVTMSAGAVTGGSGTSGSLAIDTGINNTNSVFTEFLFRNIKSTTAYKPTLTTTYLRNSKQIRYAGMPAVAVAPTSLTITATGGTASGNYSMTLYRGKNV